MTQTAVCVLLPICAAQSRAADLIGRPIVSIQIEGLKRTRPSLVLDQLESRVGDPLTAESESMDRMLLDRLGIFSVIRLIPEPEGEGVRLRVQLKEILPVVPFVSVSTSEENGLSAGPGIGANNLWGRAVSATAAMEFGGATNIYLQWRNPILRRQPWWYEFSYAKVRRDNEIFSFEESSQQADVLLGYQFRPDLRLAGRFRFLSLGSDQPGITLSPSGRDQIPAFMLSLRYDTRDFWSDPSNGWYIDLGVTESGVLGTSGKWTTGQLNFRRYQRFDDRHTVAVFSLLSLQTGKPDVDLPIYMTYGIGGTDSVRGWNLGAREGKNQWLNTVEYRFRLVKLRPIHAFGYTLYWGLHFAVYSDVGTAWTNPDDFSRNFIGSVGYGIRLVVPYVGVIRFDRAYGNALRPCYGLGERADLWGERVR